LELKSDCSVPEIWLLWSNVTAPAAAASEPKSVAASPAAVSVERRFTFLIPAKMKAR
jgi:hypothetical protein